MSRTAYIIFTIVTALIKIAILAWVFFWWLPSLGVNIPVWGLALIAVAFLIYEVVTYKLGQRALQKKPTITPEAIVGCCGRATTPLEPNGYVTVNGERWRAVSKDTNIEKGASIIVLELDKLTLLVGPLSRSNSEAGEA